VSKIQRRGASRINDFMEMYKNLNTFIDVKCYHILEIKWEDCKSNSACFICLCWRLQTANFIDDRVVEINEAFTWWIAFSTKMYLWFYEANERLFYL